MESRTYDVSYTFGEDFTITGGLGIVESGEGTISLGSSETKYESKDVIGYGAFIIGGLDWESLEALIGIRYDSQKFSGCRSVRYR